MTELKKAVRREVPRLGNTAELQRPFIVTLLPTSEIVLRQKGRRRAVTVPLAVVYAIGCRRLADEKRAEKMTRRLLAAQKRRLARAFRRK